MAESSPSTPLPPAGCAASEEMANTEFYSDELDERGTQGAADRMLSAASARGTPAMQTARLLHARSTFRSRLPKKCRWKMTTSRAASTARSMH